MNTLLFIVINIVVILSFAYLSYYIINNNHKKDPHDSKSFYKFLVGEKISFKDLLTGLSFGIIFGFLDNFGLLIGISEITKNLPISNLAKSAIGNTYSDFLGASVGTFISIILKVITSLSQIILYVMLTTQYRFIQGRRMRWLVIIQLQALYIPQLLLMDGMIST